MTTKDKIIDYLKVKGITKTKFYTETGLSNGFLDSGKSLSVDNLKIIIEKYPDINLKWLLEDDPNSTNAVMDPPSTYSNNECIGCKEKQRIIDSLQNTIDHLIEESKKDHDLLRGIIKSHESINKQTHSA